MVVVSWNVHRCIGIDGRYRPERIAEVLRSLNADVVGLQEIDSSLKAKTGEDQLSFIAKSIGMNFVMGATLQRDYGAYGNAVLSKHPIESFEEHDLSYRKFEPRGALAVRLRYADVPIRIVNVHLGLKYWERSFQINRILGELLWRDEPLSVLLGDFNEWIPFAGNNMRLELALGSRPRKRTFPSPWPRFSLDRIFPSGSFRDLTYEVPRTPLTRVASDHLPIVAKFTIDNPSP